MTRFSYIEFARRIATTDATLDDLKEDRKFLQNFHPAVLAFLRENPEALVWTPHYDIESYRKARGTEYDWIPVDPDAESWIRYCDILTWGGHWGDEVRMTVIARYCVGFKNAIMFPKFYFCEWPRIQEASASEKK